MRKLDLYISNVAPNVRNAAWLRPTGNGVALYIAEGGNWIPLVLADDKGTDSVTDDVKQDLIGSVQDKKSANTINGAKTYAKDAVNAVVGTSKDTSSDMTLNGLKAYINEKVAGLE